jgi:hypothetical protein
MRYILAADPGKFGAIAIIGEDRSVNVLKNPLTEEGEIDIAKIAKFIKPFLKNEVKILIEDIHALFGSGASATFEFGRSLGLVQGLILTLGLKFEKIQPKKWQKQMFEGIALIQKEVKGKLKTDTKAMALEAVKKLYPEVNLLPTKRCKKASDGIVDAILIAEYGRLNFINSNNEKK